MSYSIGLTLQEQVCNICLSSNRKLHAIRHMMIPQEWRDLGLNVQIGMLCWECKAVIKKASTFKTKALLAQKIFKQKLQPSKLKSLSTLTYKFFNAKDYFYKMHTYNNLQFTQTIVQNEIKEEPVSDDANNDHCQYNTEFDEIDIKDNELTTVLSNDKQDVNYLSDGKQNIEVTISNDKQDVNDLSDGKQNIEVTISNDKQNVKDNDVEGDNMYKNSKNYFVCTLTEEEVRNQRDRDKTMMQCLKSRFKCQSCIRLFRNKQTYEFHMAECHTKSIGNFVCGMCLCRFKSKQMLDEHTRSHSVQYRCGICEHRHYYRDLMQMQLHMKSNHGKDYMCEVCQTVFNSKSKFRSHSRTQHKSKQYCEQCGKMTTNMKKHKETHNKLPTEECKICHKLLKSTTSLRFHMMTHTNLRKHEAYCAECDVYFKNEYIYKSHLKMNARHAKPDKECDYCHKLFMSKSTLASHINVVHYNKLDHVCHLCGKKFSVAFRLRGHIKVFHDGIAKPRKYICELCGKGFTMRKILKDHVNIHTGARPYKCDKCPADFGFKSALYTHNRLKHLKLKKGGKSDSNNTEPT